MKSLSKAKMKASALLLFIGCVVAAPPPKRAELCEDVGERVRSSAILEDYRGRPMILAFSGIHCTGCATRLTRLSEVAKHFHLDALVITPPTETPFDLRRVSKRYPKLRFEAAPCSPCELDHLLDTKASRIFVMDRWEKMKVTKKKSSPKIVFTYFRLNLLFRFYPMFRRWKNCLFVLVCSRAFKLRISTNKQFYHGGGIG
jgi:hypothetical protein